MAGTSPNKIFVGPKPGTLTEQALLDYFSRFGTIDALELFRGWSVCYHGTKFAYGLSIFLSGLAPAECAALGEGIYASQSIIYTSHPRYAEIKRIESSDEKIFFKSGQYVQFVLQCRVHPSNIKVVGPETLGIDRKVTIDPNVSNDVIEWVIDVKNKGFMDFSDPNSTIVCTGIMIRVTDNHPGLLPESQWWYSGHVCNNKICCVLGIDLDELKKQNNEVIHTPLRSATVDFNITWEKNGIAVAGGNGQGNGFNQLSLPLGLYVDEQQTLYIADWFNNRIVRWKFGETNGQVVAGGNGKGNRNDQLYFPTDMIVDKRRDCLFISDMGNKRIVQWPLHGVQSGNTIITGVNCFGITMDEKGFLYICDFDNHAVRRWQVGQTQGQLVAGGNGKGDRLNQLNNPASVFVDRNHSVYVSEYGNHRVVKWRKDAKEGILVAGGQGSGNSLSQLSFPRGIVADQLGTIIVADAGNHRIMRWQEGKREGTIIVGGNSKGPQPNQVTHPIGLSFDRNGNLYVAEHENHRVQKFEIDRN
ncbi:unnamed protein product [Adineta steineri]|uniref:RRM domain-containing protein n=1 Tax=Adineta steineri TaxID=433720 RepID=A0A814GBD1_9BILA|nr:unnamed protein product [Adineta steineri]CAF3673025.1 unnamed protein product [Adineta steineri]